MPRFRGNDREKNTNDINSEFQDRESSNNMEDEVKVLEEEEEPDFMNPSVKKFRTFLGTLALIAFIGFMAFGGSSSTNYMKNLSSGKAQGVKAGEVLSQEDVKLDSKDFTLDMANNDGGPIQLQIWDFGDEDGDYVQVFVDGQPKTEPFAIRHRVTKVDVPGKGLIQVRGIRDGNGKGITYGVFFNKTGETYLNTVPLNSTNTYTIKTAK